jgi:hypothetical protein
MVPAVVLVAAGIPGLSPSTDPLVWPTLPVLPALAILVAAIPAVAAPPPLRPVKAAERPRTPAGDEEAATPGPQPSPPAGIPA